MFQQVRPVNGKILLQLMRKFKEPIEGMICLNAGYMKTWNRGLVSELSLLTSEFDDNPLKLN